jgi:hypothetical protein
MVSEIKKMVLVDLHHKGKTEEFQIFFLKYPHSRGAA